MFEVNDYADMEKKQYKRGRLLSWARAIMECECQRAYFLGEPEPYKAHCMVEYDQLREMAEVLDDYISYASKQVLTITVLGVTFTAWNPAYHMEGSTDEE